jgi:hypothetical protein
MGAASAWRRRGAVLLMAGVSAAIMAAGVERRVERIALPVVTAEGVPYVAVEPLCRATGGGWSLEPVHRRIDIRLGGHRCRAIVGVPKLECSGQAVAVAASPRMVDGQPLLPVQSVLDALWPPASFDGTHLQLAVVTPGRISVLEPRRPALERMSAGQVAGHLQSLQVPIEGGGPPRRGRWLPGASRSYRSGVHEGFDFFEYGDGQPVLFGTPVLAMGPGVVVRADHGYREMTLEERAELLDEASKHAHTPDWILDRLHGRSVIVASAGAVTVRYSHLAGVREPVQLGVRVEAGDVIGWVGNSGTRAASGGSEWGAHLHCDLHIAGWPFWKYLTRPEARWVLNEAFAAQR